MPDDDKTLPPKSAARNVIDKALAWCQAHPDWLLAALLGFIAGAVLL